MCHQYVDEAGKSIVFVLQINYVLNIIETAQRL